MLLWIPSRVHWLCCSTSRVCGYTWLSVGSMGVTNTNILQGVHLWWCLIAGPSVQLLSWALHSDPKIIIIFPLDFRPERTTPSTQFTLTHTSGTRGRVPAGRKLQTWSKSMSDCTGCTGWHSPNAMDNLECVRIIRIRIRMQDRRPVRWLVTARNTHVILM
jgi:hypothetical protein